MAISEERRQYLDRVLAAMPPQAAGVTAPADDDDEKKLARINEMAAAKGKPPITMEQMKAAQEVGAPAPEPTIGEKFKHVGSKWLGGMLDVADVPAMVQEGGEAFAERFPRVAGALQYHPLALANEARKTGLEAVGLDALAGTERATETVPGLRQARQAAESGQLSPEQLEQAPITRGIGVGAEYLGVPGATTGANLLRGAVKLGPDAARMFGKEVTTAALPAAGAAAGSEAGQQLSGDTGGLIGEVTGSVAGIIAALRTGNMSQLSSAQRQMTERLLNQFKDPQAAEAEIRRRLEAGEIGTLADLTGEMAPANAEAVVTRTAKGRQRVQDVRDARQAQIAEETQANLAQLDTAPVERGPVLAASEVERRARDEAEKARERVATIRGEYEPQIEATAGRATAAQAAERQAAADLEAAQAQAREMRATVDPGERPDVYSTQLSDQYDAAETAYVNNVEKKAWKAFEDGEVDVRTVQGDEKAFTDGLRPKQQEDLEKAHGTLLADLRDLDANATPADVQGVISDMKAAVNDAYSNNNATRATRLLDELVDTLEANLAQANGAYGDAVAATRGKYERFYPEYIGQQRRGKVTTPETFVQSAGLTGDRGAATARLLEEADRPEMQQSVADYILAQAVREESIGPDFLRQYEAVLDKLNPNVRQRIQAMVDANTGESTALKQATAAEKEAERTTRRSAREESTLTQAMEREAEKATREGEGLVEATRETLLGQYARGGDVADDVVDQMLTRPDGSERLARLMEDLTTMDQAQGIEAATGSFRQLVADRVSNRLFKLFEPGAENLETLPQAIDNFRKMRRRLVDNGILDAEAADKIDEVLRRTQTEALRQRGATAASEAIESAESNATNLFASALSAVTLAPLPGGYNLQLGGAVRRSLKNFLEAEPTRANLKALTDLLTDPETFLKGIEELRTPAAQEQFILNKLFAAGQTAGAGED